MSDHDQTEDQVESFKVIFIPEKQTHISEALVVLPSSEI